MRMIWIKAFNSHSMHSSAGNAQFSQFMQKWHSLRFYIARTGVIESCDLICILKIGRELLRLSCENVARIDHFSSANNSYILVSRTIVFVHTLIFRLSDRVYVLFRFQIGVLSDILRCEWYGGQPRNEAAFLAARCTRCHAQSRRGATESRDVHYICKWVAPNSTAVCRSLQVLVHYISSIQLLFVKFQSFTVMAISSMIQLISYEDFVRTFHCILSVGIVNIARLSYNFDAVAAFTEKKSKLMLF